MHSATRRAFLKGIAAATTLATPAWGFAHHSGAMWDSAKTLTLSGSVKEFQWSNPHCWIQLLVPDAAGGGVQEWSIEMSSPIQMRQGGWKPGTLKAGDRIQVRVHPARDGSHAGNFVSAASADGRSLTADTRGNRS
jgi:hypothetical protein